MARRTDSNNPADWIFIAESDLVGVQALMEREIAHLLCIGKLAEILEKVLGDFFDPRLFLSRQSAH